MPTTALILVLLAGVIHASWNIAAKRTGGDARFAFFTALVLAVVWAPVGLPVAWRQVPGWGWPEWGVTVASAAVHVAYYLVLLRGYRLADLTVVYPLARGTGPLLSSLVAVLFLGETLSAMGAFGIAAYTVIGGRLLAEGDRGPRIAGAALIAAGVMGLALG